MMQDWEVQWMAILLCWKRAAERRPFAGNAMRRSGSIGRANYWSSELLLRGKTRNFENAIDMVLNKPTCCNSVLTFMVAAARTSDASEQYQYERIIYVVKSMYIYEEHYELHRECSAAITEVVSSGPFLYSLMHTSTMV
ncbi:hypothetical protein EVAR_44120_1 [Eumeta japonica]|uniref:Uncharacterized protein n=1 Tax=Eumeta variegata TaxID=151549 RepID=A0A4C1XP49_EUMVA|nr:hypothetical protein EVAR_44120_1 [Eumeta japonica]